MSKHYIDNSAFERVIADGNEEAIVAHFYRLTDTLIAMANRVLPDGMDLEDLRQLAVLDCWNKVRSFDPTCGPAFAYFTTCIHNRIMRARRAYNRKPHYSLLTGERHDRDD